MSNVRRILRTSSIVVPLFAMTTALLVAQPAAAGTPKQFTASISVVPATSPDVSITVTLASIPGSAALGSAQVTVPTQFTNLSGPTVSTVPAGKAWAASKSGNVITLTALSDPAKIQPGQSVSVRFTATPPSIPATYVFTTQAKASTYFTGSSFFTLLGANPSVTICGPDPVTGAPGTCSASFGSPYSPPRDVQTAQVTLDNGCSGSCIITIGGTPGDFCSQTPNPPSTPCHTHVGPVLKVTGYNGGVTEVLGCNGLDCPFISGGTFAGADFYPVWFDKTEGPTTTGDIVLKVDNFCQVEGPSPCLDPSGTGRFYSGGEGTPLTSVYRSIVKMFPSDPKTLH